MGHPVCGRGTYENNLQKNEFLELVGLQLVAKNTVFPHIIPAHLCTVTFEFPNIVSFILDTLGLNVFKVGQNWLAEPLLF